MRIQRPSPFPRNPNRGARPCPVNLVRRSECFSFFTRHQTTEGARGGACDVCVCACVCGVERRARPTHQTVFFGRCQVSKKLLADTFCCQQQAYLLQAGKSKRRLRGREKIQLSAAYDGGVRGLYLAVVRHGERKFAVIDVRGDDARELGSGNRKGKNEARRWLT